MGRKRMVKINAYSYAKLLSLMVDGEYTLDELASQTGLHYATVLFYTRELHRAKVIHIVEWKQDSRGSHSRKVYKVGRERDATKPTLTKAEVARRYKERRRLRELQDFLYKKAA